MSQKLLTAWARTRRRHGERAAISQGADGQTCSFAALDVRADRWLAAHAPALPRALARRAVVFAVPNGIAWFEIFLGLLKAGAVAVPLDASEPPAAQQRLAQALGAGYWWDGRQLLAVADGKRYRDPEVCLVKVTSGTTGAPRPLAFSGAQLLADARQVTASMRVGRADLNYALIPLGHSYGLGNLTVPLLAQGVPLICGEAPLPHAIARDFARWRPTVFPGVPAVWRALVAAAVDPRAFASLRLAISAGAPLDPQVAHDFAARLGQPLHNFYGSSETGGIAFDRTGRATLAGGVGRALPQVRITHLRGGRIRVCSAAVFTLGNRHRRGATGCWCPPDQVVVGPQGQLSLGGRRGATVKIAGRRVNLAEIAARIRRQAGIRDVWVGVDPHRAELVGAVLATDRPVAEVRAELAADTAPWKLPKKWLAVPALPLTDRGKTDARALAAQLFGSA